VRRISSARLRRAHDEAPGESVFSTAEILQREGAYGVANPLRGRFVDRR
jgi:hypothetical protein